MEQGPMTARLASVLRGEGLTARAFRSSAITVMGFGAGQVIRLASNLILTRLLFPEAFGMMAIISVFLMGLAMFSDLGVGPAIMGSRRGDDRDFLDTAWTIQILRGVALWLIALALTWPIARFYGEPDLLAFLPVSALTLLIAGFNPTRLETANRHLQAGRVTLIEIAVQLVGIAVAITLALITQSVWALVLSGVAGSLAHLVMLNAFLPGERNRLRWEPEAAAELIRFGKWIFLSTLMGFAIGQADRVILGKYLALGDFGLYNIGFFLASFPLLLGGVVMRRVLIPVFRENPPAASRQNFLRLRRMRTAATGVLTLMVAILAFGGVWLVEVMYDDRYRLAGAIVVLTAVVQMPALIILTCDQAALAAGDSRRFFVLTAARAVLVVGGLLAGLWAGGLEGALIGQGLANLAAYPVLAWLLRPHGAWDPVHDLGFLGLGIVLGLAAVWVHADALAGLAAMRPG
jgi:O-antigen/teichoic acid export membrane protein